VLRLDPLLPARLQPADYPGVKVWKLRMHALAKFGCQARAFRISTGSKPNFVSYGTKFGNGKMANQSRCEI
jgi:hypothetical protein